MHPDHPDVPNPSGPQDPASDHPASRHTPSVGDGVGERTGAKAGDVQPVAAIVRGVPLGDYQTNCFVVWDPSPSGADGQSPMPAWIVDAGFDPDPLLELVKSAGGDRGLDVQAIVLTHAHLDHIAGVHAVRKALGGKVEVWIHEDEADFPGDPEKNLSAYWPGPPIVAPSPSRLLHDGEVLSLGRTRWEVRHVPGHAPGNIGLYNAQAGALIAGDALFAGSIGRTDFPTSDHDTLIRSIREKLFTLPDETTVLPGHGPATTIGHEKRTNPFVRF